MYLLENIKSSPGYPKRCQTSQRFWKRCHSIYENQHHCHGHHTKQVFASIDFSFILLFLLLYLQPLQMLMHTHKHFRPLPRNTQPCHEGAYLWSWWYTCGWLYKDWPLTLEHSRHPCCGPCYLMLYTVVHKKRRTVSDRREGNFLGFQPQIHLVQIKGDGKSSWELQGQQRPW